VLNPSHMYTCVLANGSQTIHNHLLQMGDFHKKQVSLWKKISKAYQWINCTSYAFHAEI
jgi:hypothetical protein